MPAWKKAKKPVMSTVAYLQGQFKDEMPVVLIDLRPVEIAQEDHIAGAVSMPADTLPNMKTAFPGSKAAPVILYADTDREALPSFDTVRGWGFKNTSILEGGFQAWRNSGGKTVSNPLASEIVYVPKPVPGSIPVAEFKRIVETLPEDKFILDVRDEDEAMQGMLKGAHNIPAQDVAHSLDMIPRDKEVVIHCLTGIRAEMAYLVLKEKDYNARFLNANIEIDKDGNYSITAE